MKKQILIFTLLMTLLGCGQESKIANQQAVNLPNELSLIGKMLDSIHVEDQKYRMELETIDEKYGWQSEEMQSHWGKIRVTDSSNLVIVEAILDKYGWLSSEKIGNTANSTLFLVIQHADQKTQEKYLPMMQKAVEDGNANARSLALLEDRVLLGKGELQIYGSQIGQDQETGEMYVLPLMEPEKVNERRAAVGLGTIEEYVAFWELECNVEAYKQNLPKWIEKLRQER